MPVLTATCTVNGARRSGAPSGAPQNEAIEGRQNTCDHRASQRAARQVIDGEHLPAPLQDLHLGIGCAQRRRERGHPENVPERFLQSGKRHRRPVASLRDGPSLTDIRERGCRIPSRPKEIALDGRRGENIVAAGVQFGPQLWDVVADDRAAPVRLIITPSDGSGRRTSCPIAWSAAKHGAAPAPSSDAATSQI